MNRAEAQERLRFVAMFSLIFDMLTHPAEYVAEIKEARDALPRL